MPHFAPPPRRPGRWPGSRLRHPGHPRRAIAVNVETFLGASKCRHRRNVERGTNWAGSLTGGGETSCHRQAAPSAFPRRGPPSLSAAGVLAIARPRRRRRRHGLALKAALSHQRAGLEAHHRRVCRPKALRRRHPGCKLSSKTPLPGALAGDDQPWLHAGRGGSRLSHQSHLSMGAAPAKKRQDTKEDLFDPAAHGLPVLLSVLTAPRRPAEERARSRCAPHTRRRSVLEEERPSCCRLQNLSQVSHTTKGGAGPGARQENPARRPASKEAPAAAPRSG